KDGILAFLSIRFRKHILVVSPTFSPNSCANSLEIDQVKVNSLPLPFFDTEHYQLLILQPVTSIERV
ncbi:MAG: hypothetical protein M0R50_05855, partial [Candidatus Cloacimonetes bacterium]|nr:hypothetical protein [Candidatus Cloacimonadota bacterium]